MTSFLWETGQGCPLTLLFLLGQDGISWASPHGASLTSTIKTFLILGGTDSEKRGES